MLYKDYTYSVLIVSASENFATQLAKVLPNNEFFPISISKSVSAASRVLNEQDFDIVIINSPLTDDNGYKLAVDVANDTNKGVLFFVKSDSYDEASTRLTDFGVLTLPKPISGTIAYQAAKLLYATAERIKRINKKTVSMEDRMKAIRTVNHAKWLLMEYEKRSEDDAHHYIEQLAMKTRKSKEDIAKEIIAQFE